MRKLIKKEFWVGVFLILGIISLGFLGLKVANLDSFTEGKTFTLYADFKKVGGLKNRSAVKIGGVVIGRVSSIVLDDATLEPRITMKILDKYQNKISTNSSLRVKTSGLLGDQFLELIPSPPFDLSEIDGKNSQQDSRDTEYLYLKNGDFIQDVTNPMDLEDLIGQVVSGMSGTSINNKTNTTNSTNNSITNSTTKAKNK